MVQTLEAIKGGGRFIKVGTTGTISALMSRELESTRYAPQTSLSSRNKSPRAAVVDLVVPCGVSTPKRLKPRASADEASTSRINKNINHKSPILVQKTKQYSRKTHQIPMLASDNLSLDGTPCREKPNRKGSYRVEIVDVKCGHPDRAWANPITNRLKKLSFSKLSETNV